MERNGEGLLRTSKLSKNEEEERKNRRKKMTVLPFIKKHDVSENELYLRFEV
jgi:hypothetical protein